VTEKRPFRLPSAKLVGIAALAGIIAGAGAVYMRHIGSGSSVQEAQANVAGLCEGAGDRIAALTPFSKGQVAAMAPASEPRPLNLTFKGPEGQTLTMADFAGKTVLLNLWATWCVPCREEMPALNTLEQEIGGQDFEVVAVNIDTGGDEKPKTFLDEYKIGALGYYRDSSMGVFNVLKKEGLAFGLPATLLFDGKGCLLASMNGPAAWDSPDAKALITAAKGP